MSTFRDLQEGRNTQHILHLVNEVAFLDTQNMHGHFASVNVDAQLFGRFNEFLQGRHVVFAHQVAKNLRAQSQEIQATDRRTLEAAHEQTEYFGQEPLAYRRTALFDLDGVEAPKCKENVHLVTNRSSAGSQGEYSGQLVEVAAETNDGKFFLFGHGSIFFVVLQVADSLFGFN